MINIIFNTIIISKNVDKLQFCDLGLCIVT